MNQHDLISVRDQLALMTLPAKKRTRILGNLSRHLAKTNRKQISANKDPDGRSWGKRKSGNRKMMRKMGKQLKTKATPNEATLYFPGVAGNIGNKHQQGSTEKWTASKAKKAYGKPDYDAKPSRLQAKKLIEAGYTVSSKRKGGRKKPTIKWIVEHLTTGQTGMLIRSLSDKKSKSSWEIKLPERQLLGAKPKDVAEFLSMQLEKERR